MVRNPSDELSRHPCATGMLSLMWMAMNCGENVPWDLLTVQGKPSTCVDSSNWFDSARHNEQAELSHSRVSAAVEQLSFCWEPIAGMFTIGLVTAALLYLI